MAAVYAPTARQPQPSPSRRASRKPTQAPSSYVQTTAPIGLAQPTPDPFYGHEEISKLASRFVTGLFSCPDLPPPPSSQSPLVAPATASPPLAQFIAYALHRTRLHSCVTFSALFLLSRLKARFPAARGSSGHRLFISAFMIASKVVCDDTYSNKSWCIVGQGMFSLKEINQMEREMCGYLEWQLNAKPEDLAKFEKDLRDKYTSRRPALAIDTHVPSAPHAVSRPAHPVGAPLTPPSSPPSTPASARSDSTSPASSGIQTPPSSIDGDNVSIVVPGPQLPISSFQVRNGDVDLAEQPLPAAHLKSGERQSTGFAYAERTQW